MEKLRLGLIGCGGMMGTHAQGINAISDELEITAVCDINLEQAENVASFLNSPYVTTDYKTMVDYVDAVLVVLPHDLHYECGFFFARHKKHILMEKPLCNTEEECLRLISVCEEENVVLMCAYPVRFYPAMVKLKELVDSGEYGKVIQMSIWTEQLTKPRAYKKMWGLSSRAGGGQFFRHGCHYVDVLLWFLGNPVKGSHIGTRVGTPWLLGEGTSAVVMQFENGAIGYHGGTWGARGTKLGYDFQIQTEKGMLEYYRYDDEIRLYSKSAEHIPGVVETSFPYEVIWRGANEKKLDGSPSKNTQFEVLHFMDCIKTGKRPITDGRAAIQSLRVIWALYDAEKHNTMADLRGMGLEQFDSADLVPYRWDSACE